MKHFRRYFFKRNYNTEKLKFHKEKEYEPFFGIAFATGAKKERVIAKR